jgi:hypothetical protein
MQTHRHHPSTPAATLRLGTAVSVVAVPVAILLRALLDVPTPALVVVVIVVAFALSWRATFRDARNEFTRLGSPSP